MHHDTVQAHVTLLEQMFLVQRLPAWRPGLGARESSRPKVYVCDPGMLAYLLGADVERIERDDQVTAKTTRPTHCSTRSGETMRTKPARASTEQS